MQCIWSAITSVRKTRTLRQVEVRKVPSALGPKCLYSAGSSPNLNPDPNPNLPKPLPTRAHHTDEIPERDMTYHLTCLLIYH